MRIPYLVNEETLMTHEETLRQGVMEEDELIDYIERG
jgi:hypothetical protein